MSAVLLFIAIRYAPVESCDILHYDTFINEEGVIEFCGEEETTFFDLRKLRFPIQFELKKDSVDQSDKPVRVRFSLHNYLKEAISENQIAVSHTEKLHLLVVNQSLNDYQHVHPKEIQGNPGTYEFEFIPQTNEAYELHLDFISIESGRRIVLSNRIQVNGKVEIPLPLIAKPVVEFVENGLIFKTDESNLLTLKPQRPDQNFQEVMGAYAHLVLFHPDVKGFAHIHPLANADGNTMFSKEHPLQFEFFPTEVGDYTLWVQMRLNDEDRFISYSIKVRG